MPVVLSDLFKTIAETIRPHWLNSMRFGDYLHCVRRDCSAQILVPFSQNGYELFGKIALVINGAVEIWLVTISGSGLDYDYILLPHMEEIARRQLMVSPNRARITTGRVASPPPGIHQISPPVSMSAVESPTSAFARDPAMQQAMQQMALDSLDRRLTALGNMTWDELQASAARDAVIPTVDEIRAALAGNSMRIEPFPNYQPVPASDTPTAATIRAELEAAGVRIDSPPNTQPESDTAQPVALPVTSRSLELRE